MNSLLKRTETRLTSGYEMIVLRDFVEESKGGTLAITHLSAGWRSLCDSYEQQQVTIGKKQPGRYTPLALPQQDLFLPPSYEILVECKSYKS